MRITDENTPAAARNLAADAARRTESLARASILVRLMLGMAISALPIVAQRAVVEGYALDTNGKPMPGTTVWIKSAQEKTTSGVIAVPIIGKNTVGVAGVDLGAITYPAFLTFKHADKKTGHYKFSVPGKYNPYQLTADCCDRGLFHHDYVSHSGPASVDTVPGQTARLNLVLKPSRSQ